MLDLGKQSRENLGWISDLTTNASFFFVYVFYMCNYSSLLSYFLLGNFFVFIDENPLKEK